MKPATLLAGVLIGGRCLRKQCRTAQDPGCRHMAVYVKDLAKTRQF